MPTLVFDADLENNIMHTNILPQQKKKHYFYDLWSDTTRLMYVIHQTFTRLTDNDVLVHVCRLIVHLVIVVFDVDTAGDNEAFFGHHAFGGMYQPALKTLQRCKATCQASTRCSAFDLNHLLMTCWFHTSTACSPLVQQPCCDHYKLVKCRE